MMVGILWMFQVIAFILVGLRLYTRLVVLHVYGIDDHFFNFAVVSKSHIFEPLPMSSLLPKLHCYYPVHAMATDMLLRSTG